MLINKILDKAIQLSVSYKLFYLFIVVSRRTQVNPDRFIFHKYINKYVTLII